MKKSEVELIIFKLTVDGQEAINMKIYKNGITFRQGLVDFLNLAFQE